ncbi:MAG TPA: hypothetical protein VEG60_33165, partial [Candidatus Binatia bacterium]|nr:hypothetical protein [Candidatus Binatia bacterium]
LVLAVVAKTVDVVVMLIRDTWNGRQDRGSGAKSDWFIESCEQQGQTKKQCASEIDHLRNYPREYYSGLRARNVYP